MLRGRALSPGCPTNGFYEVGDREHHVCANVQSDKSEGLLVALAHFTAEPGKVYYFRTRFLGGLGTYTRLRRTWILIQSIATRPSI